MANFCNNTVVFDGQPNLLIDLQLLFKALALKEQKTKRGQIPGFIKEPNGFMFDIQWENGVLNYATKWSPNLSVMVDVADLFGVNFTHSYEEIANHIFGEATYTDGKLQDVSLDDEDFDRYDADIDNGTYSFENQAFDCENEILNILLERKKAIRNLQQ